MKRGKGKKLTSQPEAKFLEQKWFEMVCNVNIVRYMEILSLRSLKIIPETSQKVYIHEFGICTVY
jgi:hypothetical protein